MSESQKNKSLDLHNAPGGAVAKAKRPYVKPGFQHEKVFETMALACGKLNPTQAQCHFNRRNS